MQRMTYLIIAAMLVINTVSVAAHASDYEGKDKQDSIFQKLGDLITGKYEVGGEPIKKKGVIQVMADQVTELEPGPVK